jgi:hypothetical protein
MNLSVVTTNDYLERPDINTQASSSISLEKQAPNPLSLNYSDSSATDLHTPQQHSDIKAETLNPGLSHSKIFQKSIQM